MSKSDIKPGKRRHVYERDGFRCRYCADQPPVEELTIDHIIPVSRDGTNDFGNLVTCCFPCNNRKGDMLPHEAGMKLLPVSHWRAAERGAEAWEEEMRSWGLD